VASLRQDRPKLAGLVFSGYLDSELGPPPERTGFMSKPFTTHDLAAKLRAALDASA
jgi:hypothetical protein